MNQDHDPVIRIDQLLSRARSLQTSRVHRDKTGRFWIEGIRQVLHAAQARWKFDTVIASKVLLKSEAGKAVRPQLASSGVPCVAVSPEQFRSISLAERASGIAAIVRQRWTPLPSVEARSGLGWLVIETLRSPGNLGTILRTAEAAGMRGAIFVTPQCDVFDPRVVRASMAGLFHLQLIRTTHRQLRHWADSHSVQLVGLSACPEALEGPGIRSSRRAAHRRGATRPLPVLPSPLSHHRPHPNEREG